MTLEEFIVKLANFTNERNLLWRVDEDGAIRCGYYSCPITGFTMRESSLAIEESKKLGLDDADMLSIMFAADKIPCHDKRVREQILAACRLKETCRHD